MLFRMSRLAAALLAVGVMVASGASAAPIFSDDNTGVTTVLLDGSGAYQVNLWLDVDGNAVSAAGVVLTATGSVSFTAGPGSIGGSNVSGAAGPGPQSASINFGVDQTVDFHLANFNITVGAGAGQLILTSGYWDNSTFTTIPVSAPFVLVNVTAIPEPGTLLLLGSGLVGLTLVGRRRA